MFWQNEPVAKGKTSGKRLPAACEGRVGPGMAVGGRPGGMGRLWPFQGSGLNRCAPMWKLSQGPLEMSARLNLNCAWRENITKRDARRGASGGAPETRGRLGRGGARPEQGPGGGRPLERPGEAGTHYPALSPSPPESLHEKMLPILKRHFFIILLDFKIHPVKKGDWARIPRDSGRDLVTLLLLGGFRYL